MVLLHKPKCENNDITTIRNSNESYLYLKIHFCENTLYFRIYADLEADNEKYNSSVGNKTTKIYKQNPILSDYHLESELNDILKIEYYKSALGYTNVDWLVDEVIKV